jgi:hypothetical protein
MGLVQVPVLAVAGLYYRLVEMVEEMKEKVEMVEEMKAVKKKVEKVKTNESYSRAAKIQYMVFF